MKYLLFASLIVGLEGFMPNEVANKQTEYDCFYSSVPKFSSALYSASIDVVGHHISGLLFLKTMPDSSQRAVFSNEAGITYFDFEWKNDAFKTYHVTKKLRRRVVLNTLKKDFELVLLPKALTKSLQKMGEEYTTSRKRESVTFKTATDCQSMVTVDVMGKKNKLVNVRFFPHGKNIPDSVSITHFNFNMKISLKKITQ